MEISIVALTAITMGLVQVSKMLGLPGKFAPLLALGCGVSLSLLANFINPIGLPMSAFVGIMIGLTSVGLYSSTKNVAQGFNEDQP